MEKYRKFADPTTGLNPFVPITTQKQNLATRLIRFLLGCFLVLIRLPAFLIITGLLVLFNSFLKHLILIREIKRWITILINIILGRLLLLNLGVFKMSTSYNVFDKNNKIPKMNSGFIILSNHISPIDMIYLNYLASPIFTKFVYRKTQISKELLICPLNFLESIKMVNDIKFQLPIVGDDQELVQIKQRKLDLLYIVKESYDNKQGPISIFFEGCLTNGQGILQIDQILIKKVTEVSQAFNRPITLFKFGYKQDHYGLNPVNTTENGFKHLVKLMFNFKNEIQVQHKQINPKHEDLAESIKLFYTPNYPILSVNWETYKEFLSYWEKTQGKVYLDHVKKE